MYKNDNERDRKHFRLKKEKSITNSGYESMIECRVHRDRFILNTWYQKSIEVQTLRMKYRVETFCARILLTL